MVGGIDVSGILSALGGFVVALGGVVLGWQRKSAGDAERFERERDEARAELEDELKYTHLLRKMLSANGIDCPPRSSTERAKETAS